VSPWLYAQETCVNTEFVANSMEWKIWTISTWMILVGAMLLWVFDGTLIILLQLTWGTPRIHPRYAPIATNNSHLTQHRLSKVSCRKRAANLTQIRVPEIHAVSKLPWRSTSQCANVTALSCTNCRLPWNVDGRRLSTSKSCRRGWRG